MADLGTIIVSILGIGGVWELLKYIVQRRYDRLDKHDTFKIELESIRADISTFQTQVDKQMCQISEKIDKNSAILARTHILRFDDELINGVHHSREYFRQQLQDIDTYTAYCNAHPGFKNSYADAAIHHIQHTFNELLENGEFKEG